MDFCFTGGQVRAVSQRVEMNIGLYGILIVFGAFVLLLIFNPNLSCFGRTIRSPFRPLLRKRKSRTKTIKTQDYGFDLGGSSSKKNPEMRKAQDKPSRVKKPSVKTEDYGFKLVDDKDKAPGDGKDAEGGEE